MTDARNTSCLTRKPKRFEDSPVLISHLGPFAAVYSLLRLLKRFWFEIHISLANKSESRSHMFRMNETKKTKVDSRKVAGGGWEGGRGGQGRLFIVVVQE